MSVKMSLKTIGLESVVKKLVKHSDKIRNKKRTLFARLAVIGFKDVQEHFKNEEGKGTTSIAALAMRAGSIAKWKPLSQTTLKRRRKKGKRAKILQDIGNLRNSVMPNIGAKKIRSDSVILTTGGSKRGKVDSYAAKHNFGRGVPKREFMYISKKGNKNIKIQIVKFVKWI